MTGHRQEHATVHGLVRDLGVEGVVRRLPRRMVAVRVVNGKRELHFTLDGLRRFLALVAEEHPEKAATAHELRARVDRLFGKSRLRRAG